MKRFHVHVHVNDLAQNIAFYSKMFGTEPARVESDYAKWMLDEPAVNFAISTRGEGHTGVNHLGIQVDNAQDLQAMKAQAQAADLSLIDEGSTTCCYAQSDKHWIIDPQGQLNLLPLLAALDRATQVDQAAARFHATLVAALGRYTLAAAKIHADDTPVPVLQPGRGKTKTGRLWVYVRDDRPIGSSAVRPPARNSLMLPGCSGT